LSIAQWSVIGVITFFRTIFPAKRAFPSHPCERITRHRHFVASVPPASKAVRPSVGYRSWWYRGRYARAAWPARPHRRDTAPGNCARRYAARYRHRHQTRALRNRSQTASANGKSWRRSLLLRMPETLKPSEVRWVGTVVTRVCLDMLRSCAPRKTKALHGALGSTGPGCNRELCRNR
jgi:hypothetical protein